MTTSRGRVLGAAIACSIAATVGGGRADQPAREQSVLTGVPVERLREVEVAAEKTWSALIARGEPGWIRVRSPFFASDRWPTRQTTWTSYLYAYGPDPKGGIHAGERVARPWARVKLDAASRTLSLVRIGDRLVDSGEIQGVRPLEAPSALILQREPEFRAWLLANPEWSTMNRELYDLQQFYRIWMASNDVFVAHIEPAHREFVNGWVHVLVK